MLYVEHKHLALQVKVPYSFQMSPSLMGCHVSDVVFGETKSLLLLPISVWPFLYRLSCKRSILLVFSWFSEIVIQYVVVDLCAYGKK